MHELKDIDGFKKELIPRKQKQVSDRGTIVER
jgi:hypothetical protein